MPAGFDVAKVAARLTIDCVNPDDPALCQQVKIAELRGEGALLYVPTTLTAGADDRLAVICLEISDLPLDVRGRELGFRAVATLYASGEMATICDVNG